MNFDIELVLVVGSFITGIIWLLDILFLSKKRVVTEPPVDETAEIEHPEPWYVEYAKSFFPVLIIVLILRSFVAEPFRIPSGSMMPTLLIGDFILVNKFSYGVRLPVVHTRILELGEPDRGDVVVFRYPKNPSIDYIKRVVGVPGDHVAYYDKQLYINGKPATQDLQGDYLKFDPAQAKPGELLITEDLTGIEHDILIDETRISVEGEFVVPANSYFVMGDNRDNSNDSRFWGVVPEENLVGKAFFIWMNARAEGLFDLDSWSWEPSRIGNSIQ